MGGVSQISERGTAEIDRLACKVLGKFFNDKSFGIPLLIYSTDLMQKSDGAARVVIGIAGVPGSGKSTVAEAVSRRANAIYQEQKPEQAGNSVVVDIPMDGFHYSRAHLSQMPDPVEATHRRGAAFTFDAEGFLDLIQQLTASPIVALQAPSFDHAVKDPVSGGIEIPAGARVVLVEGNYCALNRAPWTDAAKLMTELWYIDVPTEVAHKRVAARHLASGICNDEKSAWERATGTDELNAKDISENRLPCHEVLNLI